MEELKLFNTNLVIDIQVNIKYVFLWETELINCSTESHLKVYKIHRQLNIYLKFRGAHMMVIALGNIIISSNLDYIGSQNSKSPLSYPVTDSIWHK